MFLFWVRSYWLFPCERRLLPAVLLLRRVAVPLGGTARFLVFSLDGPVSSHPAQFARFFLLSRVAVFPKTPPVRIRTGPRLSAESLALLSFSQLGYCLSSQGTWHQYVANCCQIGSFCCSHFLRVTFFSLKSCFFSEFDHIDYFPARGDSSQLFSCFGLQPRCFSRFR